MRHIKYLFLFCLICRTEKNQCAVSLDLKPGRDIRTEDAAKQWQVEDKLLQEQKTDPITIRWKTEVDAIFLSWDLFGKTA